jgi:polysaccharide biosynthesis protein PslH
VRILICSSQAPLPPINGFRLHLSALLAELKTRHDVRVLGVRMPGQVAPSEFDGLRLVSPSDPGLIERRASFARDLVRGRPLGTGERAASLRASLREELERFRPDVVHLSSGRLSLLADDLIGIPSVLVALDAWHVNQEARAEHASSGLRRRALRFEAARIRRFESLWYRRFARVIVVSDEDRAALQALDSELAVTVIPNGVDYEAFAPDPSASVDPDRVVFTGVLSYAPNVTAAVFLARQVMPRVRAAHPRARLAIVGRSPSPEVRALAALPGVEVVGEVPAILPWLTSGRAYACPMLTGTGIKNKLLEAMASGLPCVVTPLALQGLSANPGRDLLVGSGPDELAAQLVSVLTGDDLARSLGQAGREYVVSNHGWSAVAESYERVYREVVDRSPAGLRRETE